MEAFRGEPFALDAFGKQALWFVSVSESADLEITRERFSLHMYGHHEMDYPLETAPGVVSALVGNVQPRDIRELRTWVPMLPAPRFMLARASEDGVVIRLRKREAELELPVPSRSEQRFVYADHACPKCGDAPEKFRQLWDGALVCQACGASH